MGRMGRMGRGNGDFGFWILDWGGSWGNRTNGTDGTDVSGRNRTSEPFPVICTYSSLTPLSLIPLFGSDPPLIRTALPKSEPVAKLFRCEHRRDAPKSAQVPP